MKKLICILLAMALLLTVTACGTAAGGQGSGDKDGNGDKDGASTDPTEGVVAEGFSITFADVKLVPGAAFDAAALPAASSITEVPSCAFEGTDKAYNYDVFELTAYNEGNGEVIYSIYLIDANTATDEGLYLGDDLARAEELYGTEYEKVDNQVTYTKGNTLLILILQGDSIISIEYRMAQ